MKRHPASQMKMLMFEELNCGLVAYKENNEKISMKCHNQ